MWKGFLKGFLVHKEGWYLVLYYLSKCEFTVIVLHISGHKGFRIKGQIFGENNFH